MTASGAGAAAESAANSRPMGWLARIGLTARGIVYLVIGWLAVLVGLGGRANIDQRGALTEILAQPYGAMMFSSSRSGSRHTLCGAFPSLRSASRDRERRLARD